MSKQKITPFLWFDGDVEEAMNFPAVSLMVDCETQEDVDELWAKLSAGGAESRCGWLRDRNPAKANAVMQVMLQMGKLDIARLQQAYDGAR